MLKLIAFICFGVIFVSVHAQENITVCHPEDNLQDCIDTSKTNTISLLKGVYNVQGVLISSNTTFIVPKHSTIRLGDDAVLDPDAFGGEANFVLASIGSKNNMIENVHIIVDGEIDGNKIIHTYEKGGVEGIDWKWVSNSTISGTGVIHSVNGDGIDLDATFNSVISGVTVRDNGDSGIHFGSPRPIAGAGSKNNVVIDVKSINNGFRIGKSGFDLSWPNPDGVIYVNCTAIDNYRNFFIEASGGAIYNAISNSSGKVVKEDDINGADYAVVNGENITNKKLISTKTQILIKRDIKKLLGMNYHKHLDGIKY
jgi:hypothetical protein